jgi:hypothetical protein
MSMRIQGKKITGAYEAGGNLWITTGEDLSLRSWAVTKQQYDEATKILKRGLKF